MSNYLGFKPTKKPSFYFASYNSDDFQLVTRFAKTLHHNNLPLWYDYGLEYGESWEEQITNKIKTCQAVLLFFTKGILCKNSYVKREYDIAKFFKKKIYVIFIDEIKDDEIPDAKLSWWLELRDNQCISIDGVYEKFTDIVLGALGLTTVEDKMNSLIKQYQDLFESGQIEEAERFLNQYLIDKNIESASTLFADMISSNRNISTSTKYKGVFNPPLEWPSGSCISNSSYLDDAQQQILNDCCFTIVSDTVFKRGTKGDACVAAIFRNSELICFIGGLVECYSIGLYYDKLDDILFAYTFSDFETSNDDAEPLLTVVAVYDPFKEAVCSKFEWVNNKRI